jgi:selenocysteine lyase/cysteine desulfurase
VEYGTGYTHQLPALRDLCEEHALSFVVDASQSLGAFPFDVQDLRVDFAAASTYKWLLGGYGLSVFYIAPRWLGKKPPLAGWMSVAESSDPEPAHPPLKHTASVNELGCPNFPAIFALGAAIDFFSEVGSPYVIERRIRALTDHLITGLTSAGFNIASTREVDKQSGIVLIDIPRASKVASQLKERDVFASAKGLGLRLSVYIYNTFYDIDRFINVLTDIIKPE